MNEHAPPSRRRSYRGVDFEQRRRRRRGAFIEAALDLFGTRGYGATSVKAVCDRAGLTERYFYESFSNRAGLPAAVYDRLATDLDTRLREAIGDAGAEHERATRGFLEMLFRFIREDPRRGRVMLFEVLGVSTDIDRRHQTYARNLSRLLEDPALSLFPEDRRLSPRSRELIATGLMGAAIQITSQWVLDDFASPLDDVVSSCLDIYLALPGHLEHTADGSR